MLILNIGCGTKKFNYAENIDNDKQLSDDSIKDISAYELDQYYEEKTVDMIFMLSPYKYYPLRTPAYDILKRNGLLIITGTFNNSYFGEVWYAQESSLEELGFITVSKTQHCHSEFWHSKHTEGQRIPNHTLKQIVLRKK
ncbi:hypothetical protein [Solibacillus ferritrahens]|uniref:hypothetical protein n=1 Tax=Solibacillus ferritrahens TaxID=3098620 RepID=UPI00300AE4C7